MGDHEFSMKLELNNNLELRHQQAGVKSYMKTIATFAVSQH